MSSEDREKWNSRYADGAYADRPHPSPWIEAQVRGCLAGDDPASRPVALDLACGAGRNALYLAQIGYEVHAVDISREGLALGRRRAEASGLDVTWYEHDLDGGLPDTLPARFDLIVVIRFVRLDLLRRLAGRLNPRGRLVVELHMTTDAEVAGPRSAEFRVERGELSKVLRGLTIGALEEGLVTDPDGRSVALARAVASAEPPPAGTPYPSDRD